MRKKTLYKLRRSQRLNAYKYMLMSFKKKLAIKETGIGFCWAYEEYLQNRISESVHCRLYCQRSYLIETLPELMKYRPEDVIGGRYWFRPDLPGIARRVKILEEIIQKMEK